MLVHDHKIMQCCNYCSNQFILRIGKGTTASSYFLKNSFVANYIATYIGNHAQRDRTLLIVEIHVNLLINLQFVTVHRDPV